MYPNTSLVVWVLEKAVEEGSLTYVSSDAVDGDTITPSLHLLTSIADYLADHMVSLPHCDVPDNII